MKSPQVDVLFILKRRSSYGADTLSWSNKSGLYNSAQFVSTMLVKHGINSHVVEVIDNNCIDRVVTEYNPKCVIIEALWVVPEKFDVLTKLHPSVTWIVRLHSNSPFLANEGIAFDWIPRYLEHPRVFVSGNHPHMMEDLVEYIVATDRPCDAERLVYLPNYYPSIYPARIPMFSQTWDRQERTTLNIGCFGAIRPLKNHVQQALAAIALANDYGVSLSFSVNTARVENNGNNVLKNLRAIFDHTEGNHTLIEYDWLDASDFKAIIAKQDLCTQVSFSETFNIVTADAVSMGVPVVVSREIDWIPRSFRADATSPADIKQRMAVALSCMSGPWRNYRALRKRCAENRDVWLSQFSQSD